MVGLGVFHTVGFGVFIFGDFVGFGVLSGVGRGVLGAFHCVGFGVLIFGGFVGFGVFHSVGRGVFGDLVGFGVLHTFDHQHTLHQ